MLWYYIVCSGYVQSGITDAQSIDHPILCQCPRHLGGLAINWRGGPAALISILISTTGTSSGAVQLQYTLDDLQLVGGTSNAFWQGFSSAPGQPVQTFNSSTFGADGVSISFLAPPAAVRLNSTALSSGPLVMKVLQGEG
jgi:hypothetical protein